MEKSIGERERAKHSKAMETLNSYGMEIGKVNKASFNVGSWLWHWKNKSYFQVTQRILFFDFDINKRKEKKK